jgi:hypothetical protein
MSESLNTGAGSVAADLCWIEAGLTVHGTRNKKPKRNSRGKRLAARVRCSAVSVSGDTGIPESLQASVFRVIIAVDLGLSDSNRLDQIPRLRNSRLEPDVSVCVGLQGN